jgi:hypothetical protein
MASEPGPPGAEEVPPGCEDTIMRPQGTHAGSMGHIGDPHAAAWAGASGAWDAHAAAAYYAQYAYYDAAAAAHYAAQGERIVVFGC